MVLHPSSEGWPCRSTPPADGSTPPRPRCSPAGLRAGRRRPLLLLWPEGPLDLQEGNKRERVGTENKLQENEPNTDG